MPRTPHPTAANDSFDTPSAPEAPALVPYERLGYQWQNSAQTLAEGLEEYYRANEGRVTRPTNLAPPSARLFRSHDTCHVIFGLGTTPDDEALADVRTLFSTDVGAGRYCAYLLHDQQAKALFKEFGYLRSAWVTIVSFPRIVWAIAESWRMKRRWPWTPPESFQRRSLADLRAEFGIRII